MNQGNEFTLNHFSLNGKIAIVTGAGTGLGSVFSRALATAGATVIVADINMETAQKTSMSITAKGGLAVPIQIDVTNPDSVESLISFVVGKYQHIDILINNAGIASPAHRVADMPIEDWDRVNAVNTRGVFLCTRAVLPNMVKQNQGAIINIASVAALVGVDNNLSAVAANYSASKGAVASFTRQVAVEYGAQGIRCNAIAPGWHLGTELGKEALPMTEGALEAMIDKLESLTPLKRTGHPEELAGLAVYLASEASSFMTGQVIAHDGGWCSW